METHALNTHEFEKILPAAGRLKRKCRDRMGSPLILLHIPEHWNKRRWYRNAKGLCRAALGRWECDCRHFRIQVDTSQRNSCLSQPASSEKRDIEAHAHPLLSLYECLLAAHDFLLGEAAFALRFVTPQFKAGKRIRRHQFPSHCFTHYLSQQFGLQDCCISRSFLPVPCGQSPRDVILNMTVANIWEFQFFFMQPHGNPTPSPMVSNSGLFGEVEVADVIRHPIPPSANYSCWPQLRCLCLGPELFCFTRIRGAVMTQPCGRFFPNSILFVAEIPKRFSRHFEYRSHKNYYSISSVFSRGTRGTIITKHEVLSLGNSEQYETLSNDNSYPRFDSGSSHSPCVYAVRRGFSG